MNLQNSSPNINPNNNSNLLDEYEIISHNNTNLKKQKIKNMMNQMNKVYNKNKVNKIKNNKKIERLYLLALQKEELKFMIDELNGYKNYFLKNFNDLKKNIKSLQSKEAANILVKFSKDIIESFKKNKNLYTNYSSAYKLSNKIELTDKKIKFMKYVIKKFEVTYNKINNVLSNNELQRFFNANNFNSKKYSKEQLNELIKFTNN